MFRGVKWAKNFDPDKYIYSGSGYGIRFDSCSEFSLSDWNVSKNVIIFGADMSSSLHINNKKKDIFILDIAPKQELDDTALRVNYNGATVFYLLMYKNISIQSKRLWSKKNQHSLCLENI